MPCNESVVVGELLAPPPLLDCDSMATLDEEAGSVEVTTPTCELAALLI